MNSESESKSGRKIDEVFENPIDNIMIKLSDYLSPYFKQLNYTPNGITTVSLIFALGALYHLYNYEVYYFAIFLLLAHLFDCMDGFYARKYGMVTENGDKYDHFKDLVFFAGGAYILFKRYDILNNPVVLFGLIALVIVSLISVGCYEKLADKNNQSATLDLATTLITPSKEVCDDTLQYLKLFGPGTLVVAVILAVFYLKSNLDTEQDIPLDIYSVYEISSYRII